MRVDLLPSRPGRRPQHTHQRREEYGFTASTRALPAKLQHATTMRETDTEIEREELFV